ncbi:hypothetical protein MJD09_00585 [bacterium]|nr:hypothetical protein [bacterium]
MKLKIRPAHIFLAVLFGCNLVFGQEEITVVTPTSEAAEGLDLQAVAELFKDSENLEAFEKSLNDPKVGINNLDLDENDEVDFIRIVEEVADDTHVIILQVPLGENEFQDMATIEVEKTEDEAYNLQVHGNEHIYGVDYYVAPTVVHIHTWPIIGWIYRPVYRPYRSVFYFGYYPRWWRPYRPVTINVYRTRTVNITRRSTFSVTRTTRVRSVTKVNYKPRSTTRVTKKTTVTRSGGGKTTTVKRGAKKTTTVKGGKRTTTVKKGGKKTTTVKKGGKKKTTVKKGGKKTTAKKKKR